MSVVIPGIKKAVQLCNDFATSYNIEEVFITQYIEDAVGLKFPYMSLYIDFEYLPEVITGSQLVSTTNFTVFYLADSKDYEDTTKRLEDFLKRIQGKQLLNLETFSDVIAERRFAWGWRVTYK